jgi:hypothetical protein
MTGARLSPETQREPCPGWKINEQSPVSFQGEELIFDNKQRQLRPRGGPPA